MKATAIPASVRFVQAMFVLFWLAGSSFSALAASSVKEYVGRLESAEQITDQLIDSEPEASEIIAVMNQVKQLIPAQEDVELDGQIIRTNNTWLYDAVNLVIKNAYGDEEQIRSMIIEIADRLYLLEQSVNTSLETGTNAAQDQHAQLEKILARHEYLPEEQKETALKKWAKLLWKKIEELLLRLLAGRSSRIGNSGTATANFVRIAVTLILLAAASIGLVKLIQRLRRRKKNEDEVREVLGEELPDDATAADLLNNAAQLARTGDFRSAIRRAYIALLCDLEHRGNVRLHRSKTNRDYLDELRPHQRLYPSFSVMTSAFEHVWYGQEPATESEYNDFLTLYQDTVK
ncbi:MAG: DUF4129 domain-containing protein [Acidobacteria bacterium]|nr:DUF4129 domain-containing protein [Acidobacteriota bacterium]